MSLSNFDLEKIAAELKINLVCVVSKNELNKIVPRSGGYIVNLQSSDKGDGTHWVCFILYNVFDNKYTDSKIVWQTTYTFRNCYIKIMFVFIFCCQIFEIIIYFFEFFNNIII